MLKDHHIGIMDVDMFDNLGFSTLYDESAIEKEDNEFTEEMIMTIQFDEFDEKEPIRRKKICTLEAKTTIKFKRTYDIIDNTSITTKLPTPENEIGSSLSPSCSPTSNSMIAPEIAARIEYQGLEWVTSL